MYENNLLLSESSRLQRRRFPNEGVHNEGAVCPQGYIIVVTWQV